MKTPELVDAIKDGFEIDGMYYNEELDEWLPVESKAAVETKPDNVLIMPLKNYINMSERKAIQVQLLNLIETYGVELVIEGMVGQLKARE